MNPHTWAAQNATEDVLGTLAGGLASESIDSGKKALNIIRALSPELASLSERAGEDLIATSAGFIEILLTSLRSDVEPEWTECERRTRDFGKLRASQGLPLEYLIDVLAVYRRATIELISAPLQDSSHHGDIVSAAQSRLDDVTERLTTCIASGYLQQIDDAHRAREHRIVAAAIERARRFASEARTDHLTGLANRREFERVMLREVALAGRHKRRLALMMIDVDNLKRLNDRHGHPAGDGAIKAVAQQLVQVVRASDVPARVGGDEFAVAMPETELGPAREVSTRLRRSLHQSGVGSEMSASIELSVGVATWLPGQEWQALYENADADLYRDKGRRKGLLALLEERGPASGLFDGAGVRNRMSGA